MKDLLRRYWPVLVLLAVILAGAVYINHLRGLVGAAGRARDIAAMEAAGANAAHEAKRAELLAEAERLALENRGLEEEIDRIRGALPGATPIGTLVGGTGALPLSGMAGLTLLPLPGAPGSPAAGGGCLLGPGDSLELTVAGVALQGDSGAVGVAGVAQAWRVGPPRVKLAEGPLKLDVKMRTVGELPGWGAGAVIVGSRGGWWIGPLVSPPPLRLWGMELALLVGAGVGGGGEWGGLAGGMLRW